MYGLPLDRTERVAIAIYLALARAGEVAVSDDDWKHLAENAKEHYRIQARAAIAAMKL